MKFRDIKAYSRWLRKRGYSEYEIQEFIKEKREWGTIYE